MYKRTNRLGRPAPTIRHKHQKNGGDSITDHLHHTLLACFELPAILRSLLPYYMLSSLALPISLSAFNFFHSVALFFFFFLPIFFSVFVTATLRSIFPWLVKFTTAEEDCQHTFSIYFSLSLPFSFSVPMKISSTKSLTVFSLSSGIYSGTFYSLLREAPHVKFWPLPYGEASCATLYCSSIHAYTGLVGLSYFLPVWKVSLFKGGPRAKRDEKYSTNLLSLNVTSELLNINFQWLRRGVISSETNVFQLSFHAENYNSSIHHFCFPSLGTKYII